MRFWDASAIVPLLVRESSTPRLRKVLAEDTEIVIWWGTPLECASALCRLEREGALDPPSIELALMRLREIVPRASEILPSEQLRSVAVRLVRVHPLRGADALQLAAALTAADRDVDSIEMVCLDQRLALAGRREGLRLIE